MNNSTIPKWILGVFALSLLFGFGKNNEAAKIYRQRDTVLADITKTTTELKTDITARVTEAKQTHPKYTDGLSIDALITSLEKAMTSIRVASGPNPLPVEQATIKAGRDLVAVRRDIDNLKIALSDLDKALEEYPKVVDTIKARSQKTRFRIAQHKADGYFDRHFVDAQVLIGQLDETAIATSQLMAQLDKRDGRPDYVRIYAIGLKSESVATESLDLAERAPKLRQMINELAGNAGNSLGAIRTSFAEAYNAADRIERYSAYKRKGYRNGLVDRQQRLAQVSNDLAEIYRLNSMEIQEFTRADTLLRTVRGQLTEIESYIASVHNFDGRVRTAVASLRSEYSAANTAISRAQEHIDDWEDENDQSTAEATLASARRYRDSGRQYEASDPILAVSHYGTATSTANQAYDQVDTYTPPPPSTSYDSGSSSSGGSFGGGYGGGSSGGSYGGGSSGGSMGGSYGGPGSGSFGDGN